MTDARDLTRLNDSERVILSLLAEGHTAKSIAAETGRSVGAVNERLREARRKTGVGSSRELARLLRAAEDPPKNRDELVGVDPVAPDAEPTTRVPFLARWQAKVLLMTILLGGIAAALALLAAGPQASTTADDPMFAAAIGDTPAQTAATRELMRAEPTAARAKLHAERRDPAWAPMAERVLRTRYNKVDGLDMATMKIACGTTICEVVGQSAANAPAATVKRAERELGSRTMRDSLLHEGLHANVSGTNGRDDNGTYRLALYAYWVRQQG